MLIFRRLYSTQLPLPAQVARTASTPLAIRLRRRKTLGDIAPGDTDARPSGLSPSEYSRYQRLLSMGKLTRKNGDIMTEKEYSEHTNQRRSRIRGFKTIRRDGRDIIKVLGQRIYLPNLIIRLVRNNTLPGQPYNPYEATFRLPRSMTKTDIRSYLHAVYGVKTTYIRTDNYIAPVPSPRYKGRPMTHKTYKRAVVGLVDPFYYPLRLEDMSEKERNEREEWIEDTYRIKQYYEVRAFESFRISHKKSMGWKSKGAFTGSRSVILKLAAERREKREGAVTEIVQRWKEQRASGERVE